MGKHAADILPRDPFVHVEVEDVEHQSQLGPEAGLEETARHHQEFMESYKVVLPRVVQVVNPVAQQPGYPHILDNG